MQILTNDIVNDGLVLYLDAGIKGSYPGSGTTWVDLAKSYNATMNDSPTFTSSNGGTFSFDGSNDSFSIPSSLTGEGTSVGTIELWVKTSSANTNRKSFMGWGDNGTANYGYLGTGNSTSNYTNEFLDYVCAGSGSNIAMFARETTNKLFDDNWYHICTVIDGVSNKHYVNGAAYTAWFPSLGTATTQLFLKTGNTTTIYLGQRTYPGSPLFFLGEIGSVRIYNRGLSAAEVAQNFEATRARFGLYSDPDANAYIAAVEAADGQALEKGIRDAYNAFITGCKSDGIWNAIKASCILAGARTLSGALVPLVGTAPTNSGFLSSHYDRINGLQGQNTTSIYLNSNRGVEADPQNNTHIAAYKTSSNTTGTILIGDSGNTYGFVVGNTSVLGGGNPIGGRLRNPNYSLGTLDGSTGFCGFSRSSSTFFTARASGSNETFNQTSADWTGTGTVNAPYFIFRFGSNNASSSRISFYSIGESLDLALLDTRVSQLMTAISNALS